MQKRHNSSRKASSSRRKDQRNVQNVLWQNNGSWIQRPHAPHKYMFMYSGELIRLKNFSTFLNSCQIFSCSINLFKSLHRYLSYFFSTWQSRFFYCTCFWDNPVVFLYVTTLRKWWKHLRFFPLLYRTVGRFKDMRGASSNKRRFNGTVFASINHSILLIKVRTI